MRKLKFLLFVTIFALCLGISNVSAKEKIGYCEYESSDGWYARVNLYNNGKAEAEIYENNTTKKISDNSSSLLNQGTCFQHLYVKKNLFSTEVYVGNERGGYEGTEYTLTSTNPALNCYYDIKGFGDSTSDETWLRINLSRKANGSRIFISALNSNNSFESISGTGNINFFAGSRNLDGTITYNLTKGVETELVFYAEDYLSLFEASLGSTCPKLKYYQEDSAGRTVVVGTELELIDFSETVSEVTANTSYKVGNTQYDAENANEGVKETIVCEKHGSLRDVDELGTFNFKLKREEDTYYWCIELGEGHECRKFNAANNMNEVLIISKVSSTISPYDTIGFSLDTDLYYYIKGIINGNRSETCPSYLGVVYSESTQTYVISIEQNGTQALEEGRNTHTGWEYSPEQTEIDPGGTVYDCKGLIGDNVLNFLTLVFKLIRIVGPILALVLGMWDLFMAMVNGEDDAKKKAMKKLKGRIIAAVLLLLLPYLLDVLLHLVNKTGSNCIPH